MPQLISFPFNTYLSTPFPFTPSLTNFLQCQNRNTKTKSWKMKSYSTRQTANCLTTSPSPLLHLLSLLVSQPGPIQQSTLSGAPSLRPPAAPAPSGLLPPTSPGENLGFRPPHRLADRPSASNISELLRPGWRGRGKQHEPECFW